MDKLHDRPINKLAQKVTANGEHFVTKKKIEQNHWENPPPILHPIPLEVRKQPNFTDLTGRRRGRLTVIGMIKFGKEGGGVRWACRCDCGRYTARKSKSIKNENNEQDRCEECRQLAYLQREDHYRTTGKDKDISEF